MRYLGMIFDRKLNWNAHLNHLRTSCQSGINLLRILSNQNWGSDRQTLLLLYRALVRSKIDYGSIIYASASKSVLKIVNTVHNTAIRLALGAYRTTPAESLYSEAGEPSLQLRRQQLSLAYASLVSTDSQHPVYHNTFSNRFRNLYENRRRLTYPFYQRINKFSSELNMTFPVTLPNNNSDTPPWLIALPPCNLYLSKFNKSEIIPSLLHNHFLSSINEYCDYTHIYTDASKSNQGVASAFLSPNTSSGFKLPPQCSIYSGELFAILQAIKYAAHEDIHNTLILTDSLSSLQGIQLIYSDHPLTRLIKEYVHTIREKSRRLDFMWVPSHVGISGNERVDKIARETMNEPTFQKQEGVPYTDLKKYMKYVVSNYWSSVWAESGMKLKEIKDDIKPWRNIPSQRRHQIIITRLRTGHTKYTHEHLLKGEEDKICDMCQVPMSVKHFMVECPRFAEQRQTYSISADLKSTLGVYCNFENTIGFLSEIGLVNKM